jgi:hypothetical protein
VFVLSIKTFIQSPNPTTNTTRKLLIAALTFGLTSFASAQTIVGWDTASAPAKVAGGPFNATTLNSGLDSASLLTNESGLDYEGNATGYVFDRTNQSTLADAITDGDFISASIDFGASTVSFDSFSANLATSASAELFLLSDATQSTPGTWATGDSLGTFGAATPGTITLSSVTGLQNLTTSVEFRFYFTGNNPAADSEFTNLAGDDIVFTGTVIPEPSTSALFAGALGLSLVLLRRRRG